jgi:D-alanyl-D-alanine carboxypeptidase (penicillin-binding protein 5/6)
MNADARRLGLRATHYETPVGLDTPGNYSTAADLARLAAADLANPFFAATVSQPRIRLQSGSHPRVVTNRNALVGRVPWIDGVKTGHTIDAGYVLVASGRRDGMRLISVVLGTPSEGARDGDTLALLRWGYGGFALRTPLPSGAVAAQRPVAGGGTAPVIAARALSHVVARGASVRVALQLPRELRGPIARRARVGTAVLIASGRPVARVALLAGRAIKAPPSTPAAVAAAVTLAAAAAFIGGLRLVIRGRRRQREQRRADVELA